jgi:hypothetical protein
MGLTKKTAPIALKIPEKTKRLIEQEMEKSGRNYQEESLALLTEALHQRHYKRSDYV